MLTQIPKVQLKQNADNQLYLEKNIADADKSPVIN